MFYNDQDGPMAEYLTKLLNYEKIFMMNSGSEANEVAIKIARRYAYRVKRIPKDQAVCLLPTRCYWGRTLT